MRRFAFVLFSASLVSACSESSTRTDDASADGGGISLPDGAFRDSGIIIIIPDAGGGPAMGAVGSACTDSTDCTGGATCQTFMGQLPGGYCTLQCGANGMSCPMGSFCLDFGRGTQLCIDACDPTAPGSQCRPNYGCQDLGGDNGCFPGCGRDSDCPTGQMCTNGQCFDPTVQLGGACASMNDCPDTTFCLAEQFGGWPGGACIGTSCTISTNMGCANGGVCLDFGMGGGGDQGACFKGCTTDADCGRAGFTCQTSAQNPTRKYCGPQCTANSQCTGGNVCNTTTGRCAARFVDANYLRACSNMNGACTGGTCLRESTSGFPGSACVYTGCMPTMPDAMDGCPGTGVCVTGFGQATPVCVKACAVDADCGRMGYACRPRDAADAMSPKACVPACTGNGDCANAMQGATCNTTTGLCTPPN